MVNLTRQKIGLFMPTLGGGGAERVMLTLASEFVALGIPVDLVVSTTNGANGALLEDVPGGAKLIDLAAPRLIRSIRPLAAYLRRARPSHMLSATADANCVAVWARALSRTRPRLVVSQHTAMSQAAANEPTARKRQLPFFCRWTYPHADALVAVSIGVADDLAATIRFRRDDVNVIYNPIVTPTLLAKSREPLDHPWFQVGAPPVVLGVGRLTAQKDFPTLIRAIAILRHEHPVRLVILGEGEDRHALEHFVTELGLQHDVAMPGFAHNPFSYMRAAAVFALSSRWEGLSNVIIEALACGTQVVSTDCPSGPNEILEDGKWGRLVPVGAPEALAAALWGAIKMPITHNGLGSMLERFSVAVGSRQYLDVLTRR